MTAALFLEPIPARRRGAGAGVRRTRLVAPLAAPDGPPLTVIVAPAGFGKTTLLREWAARDPRPFAWVTVSAAHNDAGTLLRSIAAAIDVATADAADGRVVLVVDEAHRLHSAAAHETLAGLVLELPAEVSVALASRAELPVPVARLRAEGLVTEVRHRELAMTRSEATALLNGTGLQLGRDDADALVHATEGWPAALSLAARTLADQPVPGPAAARFGGGDRDMAEYLREEVIAALTADERTFVRRTAILDVLCAPACDSVLGQTGSAAVLSRLARSGFPLVALDRTGERYRYHRLVRDLLCADLHRTEPELEPELHRRASEWHAQSGDRDRGVQHALAADELGRAGDLVWESVPNAIQEGSSAAVEHQLGQFTNAQVAAHPRLALAAAAAAIAHGHGDRAEHWLTAAARSPENDILGAVAALRAALGRDGVAQMADDARLASSLLDPASPCQALSGLLAGVADHLRGDTGAARRRLDAAARRAAVTAPHVQALCLAQLALIALDEGDWEDATRLSARARAQITRHGLDRYPMSALVLAVTALVRAQRGRVDEARADADAAAEMLERLSELAPWHEIEVRIVLGRVALRLSDLNAARTLLAGAERLAARHPEAVALRSWLDEAAGDVEAFTAAASALPASLTTAELKILQFLPTHLSFREIAERTFVSANTVKTQANAVYRKLDVCSRSDAVARAHELGLL